MVVLSASRSELIPVFTGLSERQFGRLVAVVARRGGAEVADGRPGRPWCLPLADRVLLVAVYYRTNLTMRQVAPLFGIKQAAVHRIIDRLAPFLALSPVVRRHSPERVLIVDGTLIPVRDQSITARSKNYRYSVNVQVVIDADTQLVVAVGDPLPGNRNDCTVYEASGAAWATRGATVIADGAYRGPRCAGVVIPHRRNRDKTPLPDWKEDHNRSHRHVRARIEHALARMKNWTILRDCRRRGPGAAHATRGIAYLHNLAAAS